MRIAWFCIPAQGHTNPTLGLVRELTEAGHEVRYFSFEPFRAQIEAAGATFIGCDLVQGYYFSRPVPPEAFDRFLNERAEAAVEVTPAARKTYMSLSKALTSDFESIFYVDVVTDFYLEFSTGPDGDLEILPGGVDFFGDAREKLLKDVCEPDAGRLREAIGKAGLMKWIGQEEAVSLSFMKLKGGVPTPYTLQTIRTRESDNHHIVIGVREER